MTRGKSIIIEGCNLIIGEDYALILESLQNKNISYSDLDKEGNAFTTIKDIDSFGIQGEATLFFIQGVLANIVLSPDWSKYDLIKQNGERLPIDEAVYIAYQKCRAFLTNNFGAAVSEAYTPETFKISQQYVATLYMSPGRDNMSLCIKENPEYNSNH